MMTKQSKTVRILDLIASTPGGMRFTDIQRALWEMSHDPGDPMQRKFDRSLRGYWSTALTGGPFYHRGILNVFCKKEADGRWSRNAVAHDGKPWTKVSRRSQSMYNYSH